MLEPKKASDSYTIMNEMVMPNDTNTFHNLRGGTVLHWMDIAAAIAAQRHCNQMVVTASVDNVSFQNPSKLGDVVKISAKVSRSFKTSMEVHLTVFTENIPTGSNKKCNDAFYTFVALDSEGNPTEVPELIPETEAEINLFDGALRRRQLRLILSGKMQPDEATELKALFDR